MTSLIATALAAALIAMPVATLGWTADETLQDPEAPVALETRTQHEAAEDPVEDETSFDVRPGEEHRFRIEVPRAYAIDASMEVGGPAAVASGFSITVTDTCGETAEGTSLHVAGRSRVTAHCHVLDAGTYTVTVHTGDSIGTGSILLVGARFVA